MVKEQKNKNMGKRKEKADFYRRKFRGKVANYNLDNMSNRQVIMMCNRLSKDGNKNEQ